MAALKGPVIERLQRLFEDHPVPAAREVLGSEIAALIEALGEPAVAELPQAAL